MKAQGGGPPPIRKKVKKQGLASRCGQRTDFFSEASKDLSVDSPLLASTLGASALKVRSQPLK